MNKKVKIPTYRVKLVRDRTTLTCREPIETGDLLRRLIDNHARETMHVLYVDSRGNVVGAEMVGMGGSHGLVVAAKEIIRGAVVSGAHAMILGHNHPSGSPEPSHDDILMTKAVLRACEAVGIPLLDHIIVTEHNGHFSLLDHGLLPDDPQEENRA